MQFKVNLAKGTNWETIRFTQSIAYGAEQNGRAQWSNQQGNIEIDGPHTEDGQSFFIYVGLAGIDPQNLSIGLLTRYEDFQGGSQGVLAVNDLQKDAFQD